MFTDLAVRMIYTMLQHEVEIRAEGRKNNRMIY